MKIFEEKSRRVEVRVRAMEKYRSYLESVQQMNSDEYQELADILARYWTLKNSNVKLTENHKKLDNDLEDLKNTVTKYEKNMKTEIMSLNNDIATLQQKFEGIED